MTLQMTSIAEGRLGDSVAAAAAAARLLPQVLNYSTAGEPKADFAHRDHAVFTDAAAKVSLPALQLQAVDTPNGSTSFSTLTGSFQRQICLEGQCYLIMGGGHPEASQRPTAGGPAIPTLSSAAAGPKFQQATFIPLSRLDGLPALPDKTLSPTSPQQGAYKGKRRACHNEVEKRRRDKINQWIDKLSTMLPSEDGAPQPGEGKPTAPVLSKGSVLAHTVAFLTQLKDTNRELAGRVDALSHEVGALATDNARLRSRLADLGADGHLDDAAPPAKRPRLAQPDQSLPSVSSGVIVGPAGLINSASNSNHSSTSASDINDDVDVS